jgi:hypothetical protein
MLESEKCQSVRKQGQLGYVVNNDLFVMLKYTTKARSPWGFTFDQEDVERCCKMIESYRRVILGLICGGDGVCALDWRQAEGLLQRKPGRIAAGRMHNRRYEVWGSAGELKRKVSLRSWPSILFETEVLDAEPKDEQPEHHP